jgi:hypothetical protein
MYYDANDWKYKYGRLVKCSFTYEENRLDYWTRNYMIVRHIE